MTSSKRLISFEEFKRACEDKQFERRGEYSYFISCKQGIPFCNERVCIPWNKLEVAEKPLLSLREINLELVKKPHLHAEGRECVS